MTPHTLTRTLEKLSLPLSLVACATLMAASPAVAAIYGDLMDPAGSVSYTNIADVNGLYGAPSVSLNSLDFTPTVFDACVPAASCATGSPSTNDILTLDINAMAGQQITEIGINEGLDYSIQAVGIGSVATVTVTANVFVDIFEVNQAPVNGISAQYTLSFTPSNNYAVFPLDPESPFDFDSGLFTGALDIDIQSILVANSVIGEATGVRLSFDNTLNASVSGSGSALIRKRDTDFVSLTINGGAPVPEPGTALLLMGGLAGLASRRRTH